jgi:uncharacterized membrane protein YphA (DoxX/SURF4 family)
MIYLFLFARILFGGFFLYSGVIHFVKSGMYTQYAAAKKVPVPRVAVLGTGAMLVVGSLSVLLGVYPTIGLWILVAFLVGTTPMMHRFWSEGEPSQRTMEMVQFMKNLALLGSTLIIIVLSSYLGPWPFRMVQ